MTPDWPRNSTPRGSLARELRPARVTRTPTPAPDPPLSRTVFTTPELLAFARECQQGQA